MGNTNSTIGYANPDAVTQIANGLSTSTFSYDNNGNLAQKTTDGVITTYVYDYANRLIALGSQGATTTYGYDAFGSRVFQSTGTTTTLYPFKWYSVASSTGTGAKYATTTEYVFNGDSLVATVDQQTASGVATGTAQTRYIHPDHLGSTNVVTNASGTVVQTLDYYPYGATRISTSVGGADSARKYIDQFADQSGLDYLNARYYDSPRGQFLSQDPTFQALGNPNRLQQLSQQTQMTFLSDPQQLNSYNYGRDNPIIIKDPQGLWAFKLGIAGTIPGWGLGGQIGIQADFQGVEYYYGAGLAGGGGISFGPQITTADLSHQYQISTEGYAQGGVVIGGEVSKGMTYYPYSTRKPNSYQDATVGFPAAELAGGVRSIVSGPIPFLTWSSQSNINYSLPKPQMNNGIGASYQSLFYAGVVQKSSQTSVSGSSGGSSSGGSYGSSGTTYTSFEPGNTHSACGTLCR